MHGTATHNHPVFNVQACKRQHTHQAVLQEHSRAGNTQLSLSVYTPPPHRQPDSLDMHVT